MNFDIDLLIEKVDNFSHINHKGEIDNVGAVAFESELTLNNRLFEHE